MQAEVLARAFALQHAIRSARSRAPTSVSAGKSNTRSRAPTSRSFSYRHQRRKIHEPAARQLAEALLGSMLTVC